MVTISYLSLSLVFIGVVVVILVVWFGDTVLVLWLALVECLVCKLRALRIRRPSYFTSGPFVVSVQCRLTDRPRNRWMVCRYCHRFAWHIRCHCAPPNDDDCRCCCCWRRSPCSVRFRSSWRPRHWVGRRSERPTGQRPPSFRCPVWSTDGEKRSVKSLIMSML